MDKNYEKYLKILELDFNADEQEIKKKYRALVKVHHPDLYKNPENKEKAVKNFKIIKTAYDYLLENYIPPEKRDFRTDTDNNYKKSEFKTYKKDKNDALIQLLKHCIEDKTRIKIWYQAGYYRKNITERVILPLELYLGSELNNNGFNPKYKFENNKMYLIAFCKLRKEQRTFRLDRILEVEIYKTKDDIPSGNSDNFETSKTNSTTQKTEKSNYGCLIFFIVIILVKIIMYVIQNF